MGSEGLSTSPSSSTIKFYLTGFKKFYNVTENPTELLMVKTLDFMKDHTLPSGVTIESCTVLETAGAGAQEFLLDLLSSSCTTQQTNSSENNTDSHTDEHGASQIRIGSPRQLDSGEAPQVVWVHFGVKNGASGFELEQQAVNEATFRCPDEMGWQPYGIPIVEEDGDISRVRKTAFPLEKIVTALVHHEALISRDAGRFVCNYVYYLSLKHAASHGNRSLFVHVPPFDVKDLHSQLEFIAALLKVLASFCSTSSF